MSAGLRRSKVLITLFLAASALARAAEPAYAVDLGFRGDSFRDLNYVDTPTESKPQSKLWFHDGRWWGVFYSATGHATTIHRLDAATERWVDTGTVVDARPTARADVLRDGDSLYVVSAPRSSRSTARRRAPTTSARDRRISRASATTPSRRPTAGTSASRSRSTAGAQSRSPWPRIRRAGCG